MAHRRRRGYTTAVQLTNGDNTSHWRGMRCSSCQQSYTGVQLHPLQFYHRLLTSEWLVLSSMGDAHHVFDDLLMRCGLMPCHGATQFVWWFASAILAKYGCSGFWKNKNEIDYKCGWQRLLLDEEKIRLHALPKVTMIAQEHEFYLWSSNFSNMKVPWPWCSYICQLKVLI